jgi:hypothetical protein
MGPWDDFLRCLQIIAAQTSATPTAIRATPRPSSGVILTVSIGYDRLIEGDYDDLFVSTYSEIFTQHRNFLLASLRTGLGLDLRKSSVPDPCLNHRSGQTIAD